MAVLSYAEDHFPQGWHLKRFLKWKMDGPPKVVCVTNGTSYLGLWIVINLLRRGFFVRITVDTSEELEKLAEMEEFGSYRNRVEGVVGSIVAEDADSLSEKFDGCYGVFHTSSFVDPYCVSGFTEHMVNLEVKGAEKVVEACCLASSVRRLVFTSSLAACIWHSQEMGSSIIVDEKCWSDPSHCRDKKLWFALAKTMAEKAAWRVARDRGDLVMATICPAFFTGPAFSSSSTSTSSLAYFKGAQEMFENKVLATVDVQKAAEGHVCVYQEMSEGGGRGRHICFDKLIKTPSDALHLQKKLKFDMGFSHVIEDDGDDRENGRLVIGRDRVVKAKLEKVMAKWCVQSNVRVMGGM